jgi:hypothetical protein
MTKSNRIRERWRKKGKGKREKGKREKGEREKGRKGEREKGRKGKSNGEKIKQHEMTRKIIISA